MVAARAIWRLSFCLYLKLHHIPIFDHVLLPFCADQTAIPGQRIRAGGEELVPLDHFSADELVLEIAVNGRASFGCRPASLDSPGPGLILASCEIRDQTKQFVSFADKIINPVVVRTKAFAHFPFISIV